ncbi:hypothetical protein BDM02DRAFT_3154533 [Thelephora ganbajun]|uniref:Uncharacterized protein n=1 Tax=Thelephora ganbajun TaxID=370292 RepID=A0ACB6ZNI5_THEGA|nr:hypothetical protein BDM02DRAFT_3154533 [Thelephora ganbajun]
MSPPLGSLAIQAPVPTQTVHVTASTCHNITLFKDLMKEYRKLDDSITMRLNRTIAQYRDMDRIGSAGKGTVEDQACLQVWRELVANWSRRTRIIDYCVNVLDTSYEETKCLADEVHGTDPRARRKAQAELYSANIKRTQLHNERTVERIVRERSANALQVRCKYFEPPTNDLEAKRMWTEAQRR